MNPYLIQGLRLSPVALARLLGAIPVGQYDLAREAGRFTPREVIAHLADWEPILRGRIQQGAAHSGAAIETYDESARALEQNYAGCDVREATNRFRAEREHTVAVVEALSPADLAKTILHPERGPLTVADLAEMILGHDVYHIEQLSAYLEPHVVSTW